MQQAVVSAVARNAQWRGDECLNLLAPEAPMSPWCASCSPPRSANAPPRATSAPPTGGLPAPAISTRSRHCVELLKQVFAARYADHRLVASMIGNMTVYAALTQPGDAIMSVTQPFGGHSSNRGDGPAGVRGLQIHDVPMDPVALTVDLEAFAEAARALRPALISLGASMTLFPFPVVEMAQIAGEWGGKIFFDGAHQLGLIAGGQIQDPLQEGAAVLTGSAGKTFSGPQSGVIIWNDPALTVPLTDAIFPTLAATHQVNRVAATAPRPAEFLAFGREYMAQIVANAQALAGASRSAACRCWPRTRATPAPIRRSPTCAALAAARPSPSVWPRRTSSRTRISSRAIAPRIQDRPGGLRIARPRSRVGA